MKDDTALLRTSYWVAAIADFIIALLVLIPERMGVTGFVYPMGLMSAVAFSWGVLLIVADRKPLERRWILPPTMLVVLLLGVAGIFAAVVGVMPVNRIIGSSIVVTLVLGLLNNFPMLIRQQPLPQFFIRHILYRHIAVNGQHSGGRGVLSSRTRLPIWRTAMVFRSRPAQTT